jgi:large subunit ribosomal protein L24
MAARRSAGVVRERHTLKIRSGDQVRVMAGKDRGKSGRVLRTEPRNERLYVEGLNMVKRHTRPQQAGPKATSGQLGGVIEREGPIHISNVMLLDPKSDKPTRVRIERTDGKRSRVAKRTGTLID